MRPSLADRARVQPDRGTNDRTATRACDSASRTRGAEMSDGYNSICSMPSAGRFCATSDSGIASGGARMQSSTDAANPIQFTRLRCDVNGLRIVGPTGLTDFRAVRKEWSPPITIGQTDDGPASGHRHFMSARASLGPSTRAAQCRCKIELRDPTTHTSFGAAHQTAFAGLGRSSTLSLQVEPVKCSTRSASCRKSQTSSALQP